MPAKKTAKKKVAKKVEASSAGATQPSSKLTFSDVVKFMRANPEMAIALHKHYEDKVFDLNRSGWSQGAEYSDAKHVWGAQCIVREVLDEFNLYDLVRR